MKLTAVQLKNFRGYFPAVRINVSDLTALVGRNDVGKSTVLEALEIFFNNNDQVKIEIADWCVQANEKTIEISCEFQDLPSSVLIDPMRPTTLAEEHLLNASGSLEIVKQYDCSGKTVKDSVYARAIHPTAPMIKDLLQKKNTELKVIATTVKAAVEDNRSNSSLRQAIRGTFDDLQIQEVLVPLDKEDAKQVWESLKKEMPAFALFQSDRASKDDDGEVQNPLKTAITEALKLVETELNAVKEKVEEYATEVAARTLVKLREMDPALASQLKPKFKTEPNYTGFKLTLTGDDDIPINKRGSGVRRLILLSFFRAEAERRRQSCAAPSVIYAIEEPESSQHPNYQRTLINALIQLAGTDNVQVLLTTHVPGIASLLPQDCLRLITRGQNRVPDIEEPSDDTLRRIADELGVLPDNRVQVLLFLEGPHDVNFLDRMAKLLQTARPDIPIPSTDPRIGIIITGGGNLKHWVNKRYLSGLNKPEVHIYDRDDNTNPKYQQEISILLQQGHSGFLTSKREIENYLHPDAIREGCGHLLTDSAWDWADVPMLLAKAIHSSDPSSNPWATVSPEKRKDKASNAKKTLNTEAADRMNLSRLSMMDPLSDIEGWFNALLSHMTPIP